MFCTNCGSQINDEAVYCPDCGAPTKAQTQATQPDSTQQATAPVDQSHPTQRTSETSTSSTSPHAPQTNLRISRPKLIAIILSAVAIILVIVALLVVFNQQEQKQASESAREQAVAEQKQAEIEREKAESEENARKEREAACTIDMPLYTVKIPEYWLDKVDIIKDGNSLSIRAKGYPDGDLIWVVAVPQKEELNEGDIGSSLIQYANTSNGWRVEMGMTRWTWIAGSPYTNFSSKMLDTCVQLETGGAVTLADINRELRAGSNSTSETDRNPYSFKADEYMNENVILKVKNGGKTVKTTEGYY